MTGCPGRLSSCLGSAICIAANSVPVCSSKNIEYSRTPVSCNSVCSSGQMASCRRRYSSSKPGCSFIVKAIRCIDVDLTYKGHGDAAVHVEHVAGGFVHQSADEDKTGIGDVFRQDDLVQQGAF